MACIPYGYKVVDGKAVVDADKKEKIKKLFSLYISGKTLVKAGENAGIKMFHAGIAKVLDNPVYLGTDFYPSIIDEETFRRVAAERLKRASTLGRSRDYSKVTEEKRTRQRYFLEVVEKKFSDPFEQASFAYSQIRSEEK